MTVNFSPSVILPKAQTTAQKPMKDGATAVSDATLAGAKMPETIASAEIKDSTLRIATARKNCFDSNIWYRIGEDGSGLIQTAWSPGKDVPKGTYTNVYESAVEKSKANNGTLTEDDALALVEQIKNIDIMSPGRE